MKNIRALLANEMSYILAFPALFWQLFFLYMPLCVLLMYSVFDYSVENVWGFTLYHYRLLIADTYVQVMFNSFQMASLTTLFCLIIAYPVAYFLAFKVRRKFRTVLLFSLILPSWTSLIVQIYAWLFILDHNSLLSRFLYASKIISPSVHFLNSRVSVLVCMISIYLPFMILPLYTVLEKMDKRLLEVSADLGAHWWHSFRRVVLPLSYPGIVTGIVLVFLPAFGEFAVPMLLGGRKKVFWGNVIVEKFLMSRDWRSGAALAVLGIGFSLTALAIFLIVSRCHLIFRFFKQSVRQKYDQLMEDRGEGEGGRW